MSKEPEYHISVYFEIDSLRAFWSMAIIRNGDCLFECENAYESKASALRAAKRFLSETGVDWPIEVE